MQADSAVMQCPHTTLWWRSGSDPIDRNYLTEGVVLHRSAVRCSSIESLRVLTLLLLLVADYADQQGGLLPYRWQVWGDAVEGRPP